MADQPSIIREDWYFSGNATGNITPADASVTPAKLASGLANMAPLANQRHLQSAKMTQPSTAAAETRWVYRCYPVNGAKVTSFYAGLLVKCTGDSTVTIDLKKNGTSILTTPLVLTSSGTNEIAVQATLATAPTPSLVTDDGLTIVVTVSAGTGTLGTGLFAEARIDEAGI